MNYTDKIEVNKEISLDELIEVYPKMLEGKTSGKYLINLEK